MRERRISERRKKELIRRYGMNEERNYHTENAIMLIRIFGTKAEKNKARKLKKEIDKRGYVTYEESNWFYNHGHIHYHKLTK